MTSVIESDFVFSLQKYTIDYVYQQYTNNTKQIMKIYYLGSHYIFRNKVVKQ
jgi:hypothetical protein